MVNPGERVINVVNRDKPNILIGLSQNGTVAGVGSATYPTVDTQRYRRKERTFPTRLHLWNVVSPYHSLTGRQSQGVPTVLRVKDDGGSERRSVMGRIGGAPSGYSPPRASGQTSIGSLGAQKLVQPTLGSNAEDGPSGPVQLPAVRRVGS